MSESIIRAVDVFPFVPVIVIVGAAVWMSPRTSHAHRVASRRSSICVSPARASSKA